MLRNKVRRIMYGAIIAMITLMSLKKLVEMTTSGSMTEDTEEVHTALV